MNQKATLPVILLMLIVSLAINACQTADKKNSHKNYLNELSDFDKRISHVSQLANYYGIDITHTNIYIFPNKQCLICEVGNIRKMKDSLNNNNDNFVFISRKDAQIEKFINENIPHATLIIDSLRLIEKNGLAFANPVVIELNDNTINKYLFF